MASEHESEETVHRRNIRDIAGKMIHSKEFEGPNFRVQLPREGAALETLSYRDAEELLIRANDSFSQLSTYLAQASAAKTFFKRKIEIKEQILLGDPVFQIDSKNQQQREFNMVRNEEYATFQADLRTAETVVAYLERLAVASTETLQVVKKIRDAALSRKERQQG